VADAVAIIGSVAVLANLARVWRDGSDPLHRFSITGRAHHRAAGGGAGLEPGRAPRAAAPLQSGSKPVIRDQFRPPTTRAMRNYLRYGALVVVAALVGGRIGLHNQLDTHGYTHHRPHGDAGLARQRIEPDRLSVNQIYRKDAPGVVVVTATSTATAQNPADPFAAPQQQQQQALGSGFVIDKSGHILTNAHVVLNASKVQVAFGSDTQAAKTYNATWWGIDKATDVAVLKVDAPSDALTPLPLGNSSTAQVGDPVVAIGNPLGETRTVTTGIVSALNRDIGSLQGDVRSAERSRPTPPSTTATPAAR
jgi:S1-C subfamily serine protease